MTLQAILDVLSSWMSSVAETIVAAASSRIRSRRGVRLIEEEADSFRVEAAPGQAAIISAERIRIRDGEVVGSLSPSLTTALKGSRVEVVLQPSRFIFRSVELPKRAAEFLDAIIRAQIDRLTPWTATDAAFGWTPPEDIAKDRISLTVCATARGLVTPYAHALARLGAEIVAVSADASGPEPHTAAIKVLEHRTRATLDEGRVRGALIGALIATGWAAIIATVAAQFLGGDLDAQQTDLSRRISKSRVAMRGIDSNAPPQMLLERRKHETASSLIVLEELSKILPDNTYLTELRIEGDKLQIAGVTQDAPSLIPLIERSLHFTRAKFFAPTTRSPGDSGERFHIEAHLNPVFTRT